MEPNISNCLLNLVLSDFKSLGYILDINEKYIVIYKNDIKFVLIFREDKNCYFRIEDVYTGYNYECKNISKDHLIALLTFSYRLFNKSDKFLEKFAEVLNNGD